MSAVSPLAHLPPLSISPPDRDELSRLLEAVVVRATGHFAGRLRAVFVLGSLARGGFSPLVSDVDVALVLADPLQGGDRGAISAVQDGLKEELGGLAHRLSVFWGSTTSMSIGSAEDRFPPVDRLDLIDHGILLPVRFQFTLDTGRIGPVDEAVEHHLVTAGRRCTDLVHEAFGWRTAFPVSTG